MRSSEPISTTKICNICNVEKSVNEFPKRKYAITGIITCTYACRLCTRAVGKVKAKQYRIENRERYVEVRRKSRRKHKEYLNTYQKDFLKNNPDKAQAYRLKHSFGLKLEDYNKMLSAQEKNCAICGIPAEACKKALAVDHCHSTNKIRGLLCMNCNRGLGLLRDDIQVLEAAIAYLKNPTADRTINLEASSGSC